MVGKYGPTGAGISERRGYDMRAGILSINIYTGRLNYGAVLHSWYFQKLMLRRDDIESCEIVDYTPWERGNYNPWTHFLPKQPLRNPQKFARYLAITPGYVKRWRAFQAFFQKHLIISAAKYTGETLREAALPYDALFFESDVIWSPRYFGGAFNPVYFGALPSMRNIRKIVYSASMSDAHLTPEDHAALDGLLRYPDAISMRERYASEIVRSHTDKPVQDVLDPVLLADPADFDEITAPRLVRQKYVLTYFPIRPNRYVTQCARTYAEARGFRLVEVSLYPESKLHCKTFVSAGIEAFVSLVRNAEAVFCNSLHGACLALLFHKEFYAFEREGGGLKYKDLCARFGLENRFVPMNGYREDAPVDWENVDRLRARYRRESLAWLDRAIRAEAIPTDIINERRNEHE